MLAKRKRDLYWYNLKTPEYVPANLSVNHPDYGMSMEDHLIEKAKRASEKSS